MAENIRVPYSKDRAYPVFEANIKDVWQITQSEVTGAENKDESYSTYSPSGSDPFTTDDFTTDINQLIQTAVAGGKDSLRFTDDGDINSTQIQIPDNFILETDSTSKVTINLESISKLYMDLGSGRDEVTLDSPLSGCCSVHGKNLSMGVDGEIITLKRTGFSMDYDSPYIKDWSIDSIYALDLDFRNNTVIGLVDDGGEVDIIGDPNVIEPSEPISTYESDISNVNVLNPKIRVVHVLDPDEVSDTSHILISKTTSTHEIRKIDYTLDGFTGGVESDITPYFEPGDISYVHKWEVFSSGNMGNTLLRDETDQPLIKAIVLSTSYQTYIYNSIEMTEDSLIEKLDKNCVTMVNLKDYKPIIGRVSFLGGRSIVKYDGRSFVTEHTFNVDQNTDIHGHFFYHMNDEGYVDTLYFIMTDTFKTTILRRSESAEWVEVYKSNQRLLPIISSRSSQIYLSDILFTAKSVVDEPVFIHIGGNGGSISFGENAELNGFIINNNDKLNYISDITTYSSMLFSNHDYSTGTASPKIDHCSIYDTIGKAGVYRIWNVCNSFINTEYECLLFSDDVEWDYTGDCKRNIIKSTQKWALCIKDDYIFNSAVFLNNTVSSLNGLYLNSSNTNPGIKNTIISATGFSIYNDTGVPYQTNHTLIYGKVQSLIDSYKAGTGIILQSNPLFEDSVGGDYYLQHIGNDYPVNSPGVGTGDDSGSPIDLGAFDMTYTNLGELNSDGIELTDFDSDMIMTWIYPKLEITQDYTGNLLKYTGVRRRFITLSENLGNLSLKTLYKLHKLYTEKTPLRFFPHGITGMKRFAIKTYMTDEDDIAKLQSEKIFTETVESNLSLYFNIDNFEYREQTYESVMDIPYITIENINIVVPSDSQPPFSNLPYIEVNTGTGSVFNDMLGNDITSSVESDPTNYLKIGQIIESDAFQKNTKIFDIEIDPATPGIYNIYIDKTPISTGSLSALDLYSYYFDDGYLRGFYIEFEYNSNLYNFRIDENTDYRLYLKNTSRETFTLSSDYYDVKAPFIYVTINNPPDIREGLWLRNNQTADLKSIELTELEDKFEEQV